MIRPATAGLFRKNRRTKSRRRDSRRRRPPPVSAAISSSETGSPKFSFCTSTIAISTHPHSRIEDHDRDVGQYRTDRRHQGTEGGGGHDTVDVHLVDRVDEVLAHPLPAED